MGFANTRSKPAGKFLSDENVAGPPCTKAESG